MKRKNEEVKILTSPLAGEDARRAGEGDIKKSPYFTPSLVCSDFVRQTTSPARGEVTQRAFTLIELLVVVLIIGILAAVAVPQYQKAVWKSKFATIKGLTKSIAEAEETYRLANGEYTVDIDALSIDMPAPTSSSKSTTYAYYYYPWGRCQISSSNNYAECHLYKSGNTFISYQINFPGTATCFAYNNLSLAKEICKLETKKNGTDISGIIRYIY